MEIKYFDSHSHLNFSQFDKDREEVISRMKSDGVYTMCVGTDLKTSEESLALSRQHENIFATVGLHPTDWKEGFDKNSFKELVRDENVVGVGECGLDYFRLAAEDRESRAKQHELFTEQIEFATQNDLPLMLHIRPSKGSMDAYEDALSILRSFENEAGERLRGTSHFFAGGVREANDFLELGFSISFAGPITFAPEYEEVVDFVSLDMILPETDAPFASPEPFRGRRNEPGYVKYVFDAIGRIKKVGSLELGEALVANVLRVFKPRG